MARYRRQLELDTSFPGPELEELRAAYEAEFKPRSKRPSLEAWSTFFKLRCEASLYEFAKYVLGMREKPGQLVGLSPRLHGPVCEWLQAMDPQREVTMTPALRVRGGRRKLLMLPVVHLKCEGMMYHRRNKGRLFCGLDTETGKVKQTAFRQEAGPRRMIYRLRTVSGREIEITSNHPFLCWGPQWKSIDDGLKAGDWIGVVGRGQFGVEHDPNLARMVGWMIGDASIPRQVVTIYDRELQQIFIDLAARCGFKAHVQESDPDNVCVLGMRPQWREWGLLEAKSADKFVPAWILRGDKETVTAFLQGYFEADGTLLSGHQSRPTASFTTISKQLSLDIQHLLIKFGFQARRFELENEDGRHKWMPVGYRWYQVTFADTQGVVMEVPLSKGGISRSSWMMPPEWRDEIGYGEGYQLRKQGIRFDIDRRYQGGGATSREKLKRIASALSHDFLTRWCEADVAWEPIRSIEEIGEDETVSIETDTHTLADGDIISHNTSIASHALPLHVLIQPQANNLYFPDMPGRDARILLHGETKDKASENAAVIRQHLQSNKVLRYLWPEMMWSAVTEAPVWKDVAFTVRRSGQRILAEPTITAIGVGTALEQRHYDLIVMDDLATLEAAQSEVVMNYAKTRRKACRSRLDNLTHSIEIGVGTHWTSTDIYIDWRKDSSVEVCIRAAIEDEKPIWPEKHTLEELLALRQEEQMGVMLFSANYMNRPVNPGFTALDWDEVRSFSYDKERGEVVWEETPVDAELSSRGSLAGLANANLFALHGRNFRGMTLEQLYRVTHDREPEDRAALHEKRLARLLRQRDIHDEGSAQWERLNFHYLRRQGEHI